MKHFAIAAVILGAASAATAGSLDAPADPPVIAPAVIAEDAASSSAPSAMFVLALMTVAMFGAAASSN